MKHKSSTPSIESATAIVQALRVVMVFRGAGGEVAKSAALLPDSEQPPDLRAMAVELLGAGAAAVPSKQLALLPYPTRSTTLVPKGQTPDKGVVELTSATFPAVAAREIVPTTSAAGSCCPLLPPDAC